MLTIGLIDNCPAHHAGIRIIFQDYLRHIHLIPVSKPHEFVDNAWSPDLLVVGVSHGRSEEGLNIVRQCKSSFPRVPLIVYEESYDRQVAEAYLESGVKGYILKQNIISEIIPCIREVLKGHKYLCGIMRHIVPGSDEHATENLSELTTSLAYAAHTSKRA